MRRTSFALLLPSLLLAGCPPAPPVSPPPRCTAGVLGDLGRPIEIELLHIAADLSVRPVLDCGPVDILRPPQGGRMVFIGVRATNLDGCGLDLNAALRDPATLRVVGAEERTINLKTIAGRPGWGEADGSGELDQSGFSSFSNIPVCPNFTRRDVQRQPHLLDVKITDRTGRVGKASALVVLRCGQAEPRLLAECECSCEANNRLDKCINVTDWDAGTQAGACPPAADGGAGGDGG